MDPIRANNSIIYFDSVGYTSLNDYIEKGKFSKIFILVCFVFFALGGYSSDVKGCKVKECNTLIVLIILTLAKPLTTSKSPSPPGASRFFHSVHVPVVMVTFY